MSYLLKQCHDLRPYFFGALSIAFKMPGGGLRLFIIGNTLQLTSAKCVGYHARYRSRRVGVGPKRSCEMASYVFRTLIESPNPKVLILKISLKTINPLNRQFTLEKNFEVHPGSLQAKTSGRVRELLADFADCIGWSRVVIRKIVSISSLFGVAEILIAWTHTEEMNPISVPAYCSVLDI